MATWLTHLRIAEKIKEKVKDIDLDYFMAGSIAPDSGKKEITHFCKGDSKDKHIDLKDFHNKYLKPEKLFTRSDKTRSFYWGYYFHLIGDSLWYDMYYRSIKIKHEGKEDFVYLFRDEMNSLDFEYLEKNPDNNVFSQFQIIKVNAEFFTELSPLLIYKHIEKIKNYYVKENYELNKEYQFLDDKVIEKFIDLTVAKSIAAFYK